MYLDKINNPVALQESTKTPINHIFFKQIDKYNNLSKEEEIKYFKIIKTGTEEEKLKAKDIIVCSYLKMVIKCAYKFNHASLPIEDLIQVGNLALIKSVNNFNTEMNLKFITYAQSCVQFEILTALRKSNSDFYMCRSDIDTTTKINTVIREYKNQNYCNPTIKELVELTKFKEEEIINFVNKELTCLRLDEMMSSENKMSKHECSTISNNKYEDNEEKLYISEAFDKLLISMKNLTDLEKKVLFLSYGLNGIKPINQRKIGIKLNKSQAYISRVRMKALLKIKENTNIRNLFEENLESKLITEEYDNRTNNLKLENFTNELKLIEDINTNDIISNDEEKMRKIIKKIDYLIRRKKLSSLKILLSYSNIDIHSEILIKSYLKNNNCENALLLSSYFPQNLNIQRRIMRYYLEIKDYKSFIDVAILFKEEEKVQEVLCKVYYKLGLLNLTEDITSNFPQNKTIILISQKIKEENKNKIRIKNKN